MKKSIRSVFLVFVFLMILLSGCASTPTPVPSTLIPFLLPLPTFTPLPTRIPTITPLPTNTPLPIARIVSTDGQVFNISDVIWKEYESWDSKMGGYNERWQVKALELYTNLTTVHIPFDKVTKIERISDIDRKFNITLLNGENIEGTIQRRQNAEFLNCTLAGKTTIEGYPADFTISFTEVTSVAFRQEQGLVLGTVTAGNAVKTEISEPYCLMDSNPDWHGTSQTDVLKFEVGKATIEIPFADIARIAIGVNETTLTLRNGKEIVGRAMGYYIEGNTTIFGLPATFYAPFNELESATFP